MGNVPTLNLLHLFSAVVSFFSFNLKKFWIIFLKLNFHVFSFVVLKFWRFFFKINIFFLSNYTKKAKISNFLVTKWWKFGKNKNGFLGPSWALSQIHPSSHQNLQLPLLVILWDPYFSNHLCRNQDFIYEQYMLCYFF